MKSAIFKTFVLALLLIGQVNFAYAQTAQSAALLPNATQVFLDNNGKVLSSGKVYFYIPGTTTSKMVWQDDSQTTPWSQPIILTAAGRPPGDKGIYGNGVYRQIVKDKNNNIIWDQPTSATGTGGGSGTLVGDGNSVGTILTWSGMIAPNQYQFAYGQALVRATYPELLQAVTLNTNLNCIGGNTTLTGISDTTNIPVGAAIEANCVVAGSTVVSKTINSVTISVAANISTSTTGRFFPYGNGDGSTTFNVPDLRGRVIPGRTNMGGVVASNLTPTYYGSSPDAVGAIGGDQSQTLITANLPPYTPAGTIANGAITININSSYRVSNGNRGDIPSGSANQVLLGPVAPNITASQAPSIFTGTAQGGTSTAFAIIPPSITLNYVIKVTPDTSISGLFGVASIGGMQGVIACGSGVTCAGNTISASVPGAGGNDTQVQFNNLGILDGNSCFVWVSPALNIGLNGTCGGQLKLAGDTSGILTQTVASIAGTPIITWGNSTGTPVVTASSPLSINTTTGNLTLNTVPVAQGGTNCSTASGTCLDNITGFSSTGFITRTGAGAYAFQSTTNGIINSNLAQAGAATLKGNPTGSTANVQDFTIQGLTQTVTPSATNDRLPIYDSATGVLKSISPAQLAASGSAGGSNGQIQYNNAGSFGGFTASGDATINTGTGAVSVTSVRGVPVDPTGSSVNDLLSYNGTSYIHAAITSVINSTCSVTQSLCISVFGYAYAPWWGVKCDGVTNDYSALSSAVAAARSAGGTTVRIQAGNCLLDTTGQSAILLREVAVQGAFMGGQRPTTPTNSGTILSIEGTTTAPFTMEYNASISDVTFLWPNQTNPASPTAYPAGITLSNTNRVLISRITMVNAYIGIDHISGGFFTIKDCAIAAFTFSVRIQSTQAENIIQNNDFSYAVGDPFYTALGVATAWHTAYHTTGVGIAYRGTAADAQSISNNTFFGGAVGIQVNHTGADAYLWATLSGNVFDGTTYGITFANTARPFNFSISGGSFSNQIDTSGSYGIFINMAGSTQTYTMAVSNVAFGALPGTSVYVVGASGQTGIVTISGNTFYAFALGLTTGGPYYAINGSGNTLGMTISGNTIDGLSNAQAYGIGFTGRTLAANGNTFQNLNTAVTLGTTNTAVIVGNIGFGISSSVAGTATTLKNISNSW